MDIALYNKRENNEIVKKSILITTKTNTNTKKKTNDLSVVETEAAEIQRKVSLATEGFYHKQIL